MFSEQKCPICSATVEPSPRYPNYICSECWTKAVDDDGRPLGFGYSPEIGQYTVWYKDTKEPRENGICFIDGMRCRAQEDYWGGTVVCYPYEGEAK